MNEPEAQLLPAVPVDTQSSEPSTLDQLKQYLAHLRSRYTDEHPEVQATLARIAKLEASSAAASSEPEPEPLAESDVPPAEAPVASAGPDACRWTSW